MRRAPCPHTTTHLTQPSAPPAPARAARPSTDAPPPAPPADEDYNGDPYADACGTRGTEDYTETGGDDPMHVLVRKDCAFDLYIQMVFYIIAKPAYEIPLQA